MKNYDKNRSDIESELVNRSDTNLSIDFEKKS